MEDLSQEVPQILKTVILMGASMRPMLVAVEDLSEVIGQKPR